MLLFVLIALVVLGTWYFSKSRKETIKIQRTEGHNDCPKGQVWCKPLQRCVTEDACTVAQLALMNPLFDNGFEMAPRRKV